MERYSDYLPERNFDLVHWLGQQVGQKERFRDALLVTTFCSREYRDFLPLLAYSASRLATCPPVRVYAPQSDVESCDAVVAPLRDQGCDVSICAYEPLTEARASDDQSLKTLRWLIDDPEWQRV